MNGFQCYLRKMPEMIRNEVAASKALGYNLGVKLIRGCYMVEERELAKEGNYASPIWDSIEETHESYNHCLAYVMDHLDENSLMLLGSHNYQSISYAKSLLAEH